MEAMKIIKAMENGELITTKTSESFTSIPWSPHQTFKGVYLKHLVKSELTNNEISCHIVRIDPDCEIGLHTHENSLEIHEVIFGSGCLMLNDKEYPYHPGDLSVIPQGTVHRVKADANGLYLLAKFTPALI